MVVKVILQEELILKENRNLNMEKLKLE